MDFVRRALRAVRVDLGDDDMSAVGRKQAAGRRAYARTPSGDHGDPGRE